MLINGNIAMNHELFALETDAYDRITFVSDAWIEFGRANGAHHLTREHLYGKHLFDFIGGGETRHLYSIVLSKLRESKRSIKFPFRRAVPIR